MLEKKEAEDLIRTKLREIQDIVKRYEGRTDMLCMCVDLDHISAFMLKDGEEEFSEDRYALHVYEYDGDF